MQQRGCVTGIHLATEAVNINAAVVWHRMLDAQMNQPAHRKQFIQRRIGTDHTVRFCVELPAFVVTVPPAGLADRMTAGCFTRFRNLHVPGEDPMPPAMECSPTHPERTYGLHPSSGRCCGWWRESGEPTSTLRLRSPQIVRAAIFRRRYVIAPIAAKPRIIIAHVDGSGTAGVMMSVGQPSVGAAGCVP